MRTTVREILRPTKVAAIKRVLRILLNAVAK